MMDSNLYAERPEVIPRITTDLFKGNESARFAVGLIAVGHEARLGLEAEFTGYLQLRARVYGEQAQFIPKEQIAPDGTERDHNDSRSIHFGMIENMPNFQRVVAAMRLIHKQNEQEPLPVETFFPEVFEEKQAPLNSIEVSRFICQHEDSAVQNELKWPLFSTVVSHIISTNLGPTYGVVETVLEKSLKANRVPIKRLGELKFIPEYNTENMPIEINTTLLAKILEKHNPRAVEDLKKSTGKMVFFGNYDSHYPTQAA